MDSFVPDTSMFSRLPITNPICTDIVYRIHKVFVHDGHKKSPISFLCRLKKVDVAVSELSLDTCLFLIGALKLAGPYTLRNSPVLANRCQVENRTGVNIVCCFEHEENDQSGKVLAWQTNDFLIRHVLSRRDCSIQKVSSSLTLSLQKPGKGTSTAIQVSLVEPGIVAARTRLQPIQESNCFTGSRMAAGPILVVDKSRKTQDGMFVSISPMVQIHNATGLRLELRCRRPNQGGEGAIVFLEDGDKIDDSMSAFDALDMEGDLRKALASLNLGNYLLSIRPASHISIATSTNYEWSQDVKGSKAVRVSGLFDKLHYRLKTTFKTQGLDSSFETVFCRMKEYETMTRNSSDEIPGKHFIIRTFRRKVPVTKPNTSKQQKSRPSVVAWQEQQEILLLPTIRVQNFLSCSIELILHQSHKDDKKHKTVLEPSNQCENEIVIPSGGSKACIYADINDLFLVVKHIELGLVSKPLSIGSGDNQLHESDGSMKEVEMDVDFKDSVHFATSKVLRADDGILEVIFYSKFQLQNQSNMPLVCCSPMKHSRWRGRREFNNNEELVWQPSGIVTFLSPQSSISWLDRSSRLLLKREEENARVAYLDLESLSGSLEISLGVDTPDNIVDWIQLGVILHLPMSNESNPTHIIEFAPRYIIVNDSAEAICICQNGFQDSQANKVLDPGERTALHAQALPGSKAGSSSAAAKSGGMSDAGQIAATGSLFSIRFCLNKKNLDWSGPVCAAALGSFYIKMRSTNHRHHLNTSKDCERTASTLMLEKQLLQFAVADVQEEASSLIMRFRLLEPENMPYQIQNRLKSASILFHQKGLTESEVLESGVTVAYVWDDLELPHRLVVAVTGTRVCFDLNIDKIRPWKSFFAVRNKNSSLLLQLQEQFGSFGLVHNDANDTFSSNFLQNIGYEVFADGPTRILRICENADCIQKNCWLSELTIPRMKLEMRLPLLAISIIEPEKQKVDAPETMSLTNRGVSYVPIISAMITALSFEAIITTEYSLGQVKVQRLEIDVKWQGAPFAALLRIHEQDRFGKAQTVLEFACVISNRAANPLQVKYASMLLQAIDLNLDEETLMKLAPFYRRSLADTSIPSRQIYFERFEIHPIKIFASFLPGQLQTDYTSTQETLRALLHSVIKVPSVRGAQIQLNGVLLSNALLTFRQLAVKCAQHYSWYAMRAIYIARGSKLLPPAFASLFDDSAASSLDVFFDPSNGSVDIQGLTLGMFNLLSRAIRNKGHGGTNRYFGDLESTVRKAGSNLMFAVVTEVSDNILKGAETGGFDGMVNGFRRGILNVAMEPSVLRTAVVKGGSTRRIHLQRSVGINEAYIEGYLQAILDTLFKQEYLKVKVVDDQVILKNLPPNSMLMEEIMNSVKSFLIGEGLLIGESSISAGHSLRRLDGTKETRLVPAITALCEQLFIIFAVRGLRQQTRRLFHIQNGNGSTSKKAKQPETTEIHTSKLEPEKPQAIEEYKAGYKRVFGNFIISSLVAYIDGRLCRHIPNPLVRRIVSGFLLSFVE
ncbi:hypothetical protein O6H91_08G036400 [Diphasiastrum complanatum]|uniref:Uncharacterized protein n=1 Tax=Diphasiastrum complanatum TaxID=34168 RepID=A0ACC2CWC9_DIPCM|nr:hypothetical protein O6H91_08G036400 [Diphasiastrum complanatum]